MPHKNIALTILTCIIIFILFAITWVEIGRAKVRSNIALVKNDFNNINFAIVCYFNDYNGPLPSPDVNSNGEKLIPNALTVNYKFHFKLKNGKTGGGGGPYIDKLSYDPFNNNGKGLYHYSNGPQCWIISSYGPDEVNGYGSTKFNLEHYVEDPIPTVTFFNNSPWVAPFPLQSSPFTYDPTNGLRSGGDIWQRGP